MPARFAVSVVLSDHRPLLQPVAGGVTVADVSGNDSGLVTVFAPLAVVNTTLAAANGLVFTPPTAFAGTATLTLVTNDLGKSGGGGARTDTDMQVITVSRVLDHFTVDLPTGSTAGVAFNVTLTARNSAGAVITNYSGSVNLATSDAGNAARSATFTNGVETFAATFGRPDSDHHGHGCRESSIAAQGPVTVSPAAATRLAFEQQPTGTRGRPVLAGAPRGRPRRLQ